MALLLFPGRFHAINDRVRTVQVHWDRGVGSIELRERNFEIIPIHFSDAASPTAVFVAKDILHD
jgi:hypothetical protein